MTNVLITSASRKVSLIRAFQKAVRENGGGRVIAADITPLSAALRLADEGILVPRSDDPQFLTAILDVCKNKAIQLLVPTRDEELPFFAEHREAFRAVGTTVMVAKPATILGCQDKKTFVETCLRFGYRIPKMYSSPEEIHDNEFPVFVRPRHGKSNPSAQRVLSRRELDRFRDRLPEIIIQQLIEAPEMSVDYFADFNGTPISAVTRERVSMFGGESFISRTCKKPGLIDACVSLSKHLGLIGHNTIQCFVLDDEPVFIEVNPRFGGACALGFAAGVQTPEFLVQLVCGQSVAPRLGIFQEDLVMLRYTEDLFLPASSLAPVPV